MEFSRTFRRHLLNVRIRQRRDIHTERSEPLPRLRQLRRRQLSGVAAGLHLARVGDDRGADMPGITTEHLICGAFMRRSPIKASVNPFTANLAAL